jgi:GntR family transcriptional regulator
MDERSDTIGFKPLYARVRDRLRRNIASGAWPAGHMLPSETVIAQEIGVSQGTVRKALDAMEAERLIVRRQGRGTFVAAHDEARILFQFFKLVPDDGPALFPESRVLGVDTGDADAAEAGRLALARGEPVIRIRRVRSLAGRPSIVETIVLPAAFFDGIEREEVPNNLYDLYARRFGVTVAGGRESIKATVFSAEEARLLDLPAGSPALVVDRVATDIGGRAIEWRLSLCDTRFLHYVSDLR